MNKIIVYSLWGDNPMYWIGALRNIEQAKKYYPGWTCRFYIEKDAKKELIETIVGENVEVILLDTDPNRKITNDRFNHPGIFWRFLAIEKNNIVLFRDCDSRISEREVVAVNEWLESDKEFHIMRDHPYHTVPILSGMWGCKNVSLDIKNLINQWKYFPNKGKYSADDQDFLGQLVYPMISGNTIEHSEFGINYGQPIRNFKTKRNNYEFVGDIFDENDERHPEHWKIIKNVIAAREIQMLHKEEKKGFMNIKYSIVSSDSNPMYLDFWPIVRDLWINLIKIKPILVLISDKTLVTDYGDYIIHEIEELKNHSSAFQSQVVRMFITKYYDDDICLTSDIDMLPLSHQYFNTIVSEEKDDSMVILSSDAYQNIRYPLCYNVAKGKTFNQILNLNCSFQEYCDRLSLYNQGWDTDELYFGKCVHEFQEKNRIILKNRGWNYGMALSRIDRVQWHYDIQNLKNGKYIDCHSLRPYSQYKYEVDKLINNLWR